MAETPFSLRVRHCFSRRAGHYEQAAQLQGAMARRLARKARVLTLPKGSCLDLGAGSGLLARSLEAERPEFNLLRLDNCPDLLAQDLARRGSSPAASLEWDLNAGLPPLAEPPALIGSSFALHWLEEPLRQLEHWCQELAPGGWLLLALPTATSFPQWRLAADRSGVPFTALELPGEQTVRSSVSKWLRLEHCSSLTFTWRRPSALELLREFKRLGAEASPVRPMTPAQLRQLEAKWPQVGPLKHLSWSVLMLVAQKPLERHR